MRKASWLVLLVILLVGCAPAAAPTPIPTSTPVPTATVEPTATPEPTLPPCGIQAADFIDAVDDIYDRWEATDTLAGSTPRISLAPIVSDLQEIRRETSKLEPPECAQNIKDILLDYMDNEIDGFLAFLAQQEGKARVYFTAASSLKNDFLFELSNLKRDR